MLHFIALSPTRGILFLFPYLPHTPCSVPKENTELGESKKYFLAEIYTKTIFVDQSCPSKKN